MKLSRIAALGSILVSLALTGCGVSISPGATALVRNGAQAASLGHLRVVLAQPAAGAPEVQWDHARLIVARLDHGMADQQERIHVHDDGSVHLPGGYAWPAGAGYTLRLELLQTTASGQDQLVGIGTLGGHGQSVSFQPGPNAATMHVTPVVAGTRLVRAVPTYDDNEAAWQPDTETSVEPVYVGPVVVAGTADISADAVDSGGNGDLGASDDGTVIMDDGSDNRDDGSGNSSGDGSGDASDNSDTIL